MGFYVLRVKNEQIESDPEIVAEKIIQKYYELFDYDNSYKKLLVTTIDKTYVNKEIPFYIEKNLIEWTKLYNKEIIVEHKAITITTFKNILEKFHPDLLKNECALERMILGLIGLNLKVNQNNIIDFDSSTKILERYSIILEELFPNFYNDNNKNQETNSMTIYLKNMFNITAPNFFKNLIFNSGPKINEGIIDIKDIKTLESNIDCFNKSFNKFGIHVEPNDIKIECHGVLKKLNHREYQDPKFNWLNEWINR